MPASTGSRFRKFTSVLRLMLLIAVLVGAPSLAPVAKADDNPNSDLMLDDGASKPAEYAMKFDPHWGFNLHTEYPGATGTMDITPDDKSLKLNFDFTGGGSFVSAGHSVDSHLTFATIAIKAKGFGSLGISITDNSGQTFVYQFGLPGDMERTYEAKFSDPPSTSFGGLNDKVVHFPLQNINVTVSKSPDHLSGTVEVTSIVLKAAK